MKHSLRVGIILILIIIFGSLIVYASEHGSDTYTTDFSKATIRYQDSHMTSIIDILKYRVQVEPFNLMAFFNICMCHNTHNVYQLVQEKSACMRKNLKLKKEHG